MKGDPCACGCKGVVTSNHPQARYASKQCRTRDWARVNGVRTVVGGKASKRRLSGQAKRPNPSGKGVRVYVPSADVAVWVAEACWREADLFDLPAVKDAGDRIFAAAERQRERRS